MAIGAPKMNLWSMKEENVLEKPSNVIKATRVNRAKAKKAKNSKLREAYRQNARLSRKYEQGNSR